METTTGTLLREYCYTYFHYTYTTVLYTIYSYYLILCASSNFIKDRFLRVAWILFVALDLNLCLRTGH